MERQMQIEIRNIEDIHPYPNNPRHNDNAVDAVADSIRVYGFRQPIVVDENYEIIAGNTRYKAAIKLGLKQVPVHVARGLTPAQVKAYRIADNRTADLSDWNYELLIKELTELQQMDFDMDLTGFSDDAIQELFQADIEPGLTDPDLVPEPPDKAQTRPGDLWLLGNHRLFCGDSSRDEHVDRLVQGEPIHLVNTDPPYNVRVEPRSNNAIAAGLSSFESVSHHQRFDVTRQP